MWGQNNGENTNGYKSDNGGWGGAKRSSSRSSGTAVALKLPKVSTRITEEEFAEVKKVCFQAAQMNVDIDLTKLAPPEYKYFTELYKLYCLKFKGTASDDELAEREKSLHTRYKEDRETHDKEWEYIKRWNDNIRISEMRRSQINKSRDPFEVLSLALQITADLTNDVTMMTVVHERYFDRDREGNYSPKEEYRAKPAVAETEQGNE